MVSHLERFHLIAAIRTFFQRKGFLDVITPPAVENPGMEAHIHPFQIREIPLFLHTSPEFAMKELLSLGLEKIFTISYAFRNDPLSPIHRPQFLMLEWYRSKARYETIMDDCQELFNEVLFHLKKNNIPTVTDEVVFKKKTIREVFHEHLKIDILDYLDRDGLLKLIRKKFPEVPFSPSLYWEDAFFLLFLNKIEPFLDTKMPLILYEYPASLAAYSTLKKNDPRLAERFEIYWQGMELANCFNELTDPKEQAIRLEEQGKLKMDLYGQTLPVPRKFLQTMERGLPPSSGIALGVERFLKAATGMENPFWD
jgi:lysyl-tRNA synthetase class 2